MKTFRKFVESYQPVSEAEYNKEWWDSKSDNFKKRYIERHPNSIYAQKASTSTKKKDSPKENKKSIDHDLYSSIFNLVTSGKSGTDTYERKAKEIFNKAVAANSYDNLSYLAGVNIKDRKIQNGILDKLKDKDLSLLGNNEFLDKSVQAKLIEKLPNLSKTDRGAVMAALLFNPTVATQNPKVFDLLARKAPDAAAQNGSASPEQLKNIYNYSVDNNNIRGLFYLAANKNTPVDILEKILKMPKPTDEENLRLYRYAMKDAKNNLSDKNKKA